MCVHTVGTAETADATLHTHANHLLHRVWILHLNKSVYENLVERIQDSDYSGRNAVALA